MVMLSSDQLGKRFGSKWIFRNITLEVEQGQVLVVAGRNGSGKSTLLKILVGLMNPTEGTVTHQNALDPRISIGYSALDQSLYPELTCTEHLDLAADLRGCQSNAPQLLEKVGLDAAANVRSKELSTGMRARLRLALAIQTSPQILFLDEPGASLDKLGKSVVANVIEEQKARGCVILATNEPQEHEWGTHLLELASLK